MNIFQKVQQLDTQDQIQSRKRRKILAKDVARSKATQAQTVVSNRLVECRILLHRALKDPVNDSEDSGQEFVQSCNELLVRLLEARARIDTSELLTVADYRSLVFHDDHDKLDECLQEEYNILQENWKRVLDKRHRDAKLHSGQSSSSAKSFLRVMDSSFWEQVENTVKGYEVSSQKPYDDSKLYQQLLKDFLTDNTTSSSSQSHLRTKTQNKKKQVDRRASKGRKIRYITVPKLVNFTFPLSRVEAEFEADTYFRSMFGGVGSKKDSPKRKR